MHRFIGYISDLLYLHDCVIIPDFGGFICNYKSAYIDEHSGLICPPSKDILFNRNLTHNDGLLVNWIADKENISYEKAAIQLTLFTEDLKIRLNQKQRIPFGNIGEFYTDRRFNILFESCRNNFFAEAFGMEPIGIQFPEGQVSRSVPVLMPSVHASQRQAYLNTDASGNIFHRLLKYALAVATITGIVVITQLDAWHTHPESAGKIANNSTLQPGSVSSSSGYAGKQLCNSVISPEEDYVDYDPLAGLY